MSDWAVGDLAVCVDATNAPMLQEGRVYTVTGIERGLGIDASGRWSEFGLYVAGAAPSLRCSNGGGFGPDRFRKVLPDKHEACETEFVTLLQRIKRKQVA